MEFLFLVFVPERGEYFESEFVAYFFDAVALVRGCKCPADDAVNVVVVLCALECKFQVGKFVMFFAVGFLDKERNAKCVCLVAC